MKIHVARISGDPSMVRAFSSIKDMDKWIKNQERFNGSPAFDVEKFEVNVPNTKKEVINWFNEHGWHEQ